MANDMPKFSEVFELGTEVTYEQAVSEAWAPFDNAMKSVPSISPIETCVLLDNKIIPTSYLIQIELPPEVTSGILNFIDQSAMRDGATLSIRIKDNTNPITVKNGVSGSGGILTTDSNDVILNDFRNVVSFQREGTIWRQAGGISAQADWDETDTTKASFIKNKPDGIITEDVLTQTIDKNSTEDEAPSAKASYTLWSKTAAHNLGEIFTDGFVELLEGQGWCEGDVLPSGAYSGLVAEFDKYTVDNTKGIKWVDFSTYASTLLANNGNCIYFGYDVVNNLIRLPTIQDGVGIFQANTISENNKYYNDQLQGHIHGRGLGGSANAPYVSTNVFMLTSPTISGFVLPNDIKQQYQSDDIHGTPRVGSETRNKQIRRRFKVQLANVGVQASESNYNEFIEGLTNKADKDLENVETNIDFVIASWSSTDGKNWYKLYKSGFKIQAGIRETPSSGTVPFWIPFTKIANVQRTNFSTSGGPLTAAGAGFSIPTLTNFYMFADGGISPQYWLASGY